MLPPIRKVTISVAFVFVRPSVCLSVRPSVAYIANNSRTQRPGVPKFGRKIPHFALWIQLAYQCQGQKVKGQGHQAHSLTHIVRHIFRMARPTNFNLGVRMEDDDPHQPQAPWPPRSKVKVVSSHHLYVSSLPLPNSGNKMLYLCH